MVCNSVYDILSAIRSIFPILYVKYVVDNVQDDLHLPAEVVIGKDSMCFNVTAIDDDLLEGFEFVYILLYNPNDEDYDFCPDKSVLSILVADNDGMTLVKCICILYLY